MTSEENNGKAVEEVSKDLNLSSFVANKILSNNSRAKTITLLGSFPNISATDVAVVILEKKAFFVEQVFGKSEQGEGDQKQTIFEFTNSTNKEFVNDCYHSLTTDFDPASSVNKIKTTIIYPATELHIKKYSQQNLYIIQETYKLFQHVTEPYLTSKQFSLDWVWNILEHKQEVDRIVFEDPDDETGFVLLPDLKWDGKTKETLYLIAICRCKGIRSLRDLTAKHLPLLRNIRDASVATISEKYGIERSQLRIYVHYQPSFYHFHVHFTYLKHEAPGIHCERSHLIDSVISNIELLPDYYQKATLSFTVRESDDLHQKYNEIINENSTEPSKKKIRTE